MARKTRKIDFKINENNCFVCTSHKQNWNGYPLMRMNKKIIRIHRYVYEECYGIIPEGMVIRHKCDNTSCINPEHLEIGTQLDNIRDMVERGRVSNKGLKGEENGRAKLTKEKVIEIREKYKNGTKPTDLIREYGVKDTAIYDIIAKRSWKHI